MPGGTNGARGPRAAPSIGRLAACEVADFPGSSGRVLLDDHRPYTPASHFARGKADPRFRTKLQIAAELVAQARATGLPCRAVVADSFYGEDEPLRAELRAHDLG